MKGGARGVQVLHPLHPPPYPLLFGTLPSPPCQSGRKPLKNLVRKLRSTITDLTEQFPLKLLRVDLDIHLGGVFFNWFRPKSIRFTQ